MEYKTFLIAVNSRYMAYGQSGPVNPIKYNFLKLYQLIKSKKYYDNNITVNQSYVHKYFSKIYVHAYKIRNQVLQ